MCCVSQLPCNRVAPQCVVRSSSFTPCPARSPSKPTYEHSFLHHFRNPHDPAAGARALSPSAQLLSPPPPPSLSPCLLPHRLPHCVSSIVSLSLCHPRRLSHRVFSLTVFLTASPPLCLSHCVSPAVSPLRHAAGGACGPHGHGAGCRHGRRTPPRSSGGAGGRRDDTDAPLCPYESNLSDCYVYLPQLGLHHPA
jgi:hypothetical protein